MSAPSIPRWALTLDVDQMAELLADLDAHEFCACDHRDDQHGPDGSCEVCGPVVCFAWNPVQR